MAVDSGNSKKKNRHVESTTARGVALCCACAKTRVVDCTCVGTHHQPHGAVGGGGGSISVSIGYWGGWRPIVTETQAQPNLQHLPCLFAIPFLHYLSPRAITCGRLLTMYVTQEPHRSRRAAQRERVLCPLPSRYLVQYQGSSPLARSPVIWRLSAPISVDFNFKSLVRA